MNAKTFPHQKLMDDPYDIFHDLDHHKAVWKGCLKIIETESITGDDIDLDALEIACMWHDYFRKAENEKELLRSNLSKFISDEIVLNKILQIIAEHGFEKTQTLLESKILYDADKIEILSKERWQKGFDAYDNGQISLEIRDKYVKEWNRRDPLLINNLHFKSSNETYIQKREEFIEWLKSIGRFEANVFV